MSYGKRVFKMEVGKKYLRVGLDEMIVECVKVGKGAPQIVDSKGNRWSAILNGTSVTYHELDSELAKAKDL